MQFHFSQLGTSQDLLASSHSPPASQASSSSWVASTQPIKPSHSLQKTSSSVSASSSLFSQTLRSENHQNRPLSPTSPILFSQTPTQVTQASQMHATQEAHASPSQFHKSSAPLKPSQASSSFSSLRQGIRDIQPNLSAVPIMQKTSSPTISAPSTRPTTIPNAYQPLKRSSIQLGIQGAQRAASTELQTLHSQQLLHNALDSNRDAINRLNQSYEEGFTTLRDMLRQLLSQNAELARNRAATMDHDAASAQEAAKKLEDLKSSLAQLELLAQTEKERSQTSTESQSESFKAIQDQLRDISAAISLVSSSSTGCQELLQQQMSVDRPTPATNDSIRSMLEAHHSNMNHSIEDSSRLLFEAIEKFSSVALREADSPSTTTTTPQAFKRKDFSSIRPSSTLNAGFAAPSTRNVNSNFLTSREAAPGAAHIRDDRSRKSHHPPHLSNTSPPTTSSQERDAPIDDLDTWLISFLSKVDASGQAQSTPDTEPCPGASSTQASSQAELSSWFDDLDGLDMFQMSDSRDTLPYNINSTSSSTSRAPRKRFPSRSSQKRKKVSEHPPLPEDLMDTPVLTRRQKQKAKIGTYHQAADGSWTRN